MKDYKVNRAFLNDTFKEQVYQIVEQIPTGKVFTYGSIATLLGVPQHSGTCT